MAELRYIDDLGREREVDTRWISRVETADGEHVVTLRDENGSRYDLNEAQARMVARQSWASHKQAVRSCEHCYWHDVRPDREDCPVLCCRMREAALEAGVDLQVHARRPTGTSRPGDPFREGLAAWLLRNTLAAWLLLALKVDLRLYAAALLTLLLALTARWLYYYYRG